MKDNVELNYSIKSEVGFYDLIDYDYLDRVKDLKDSLKLNKVKANYRKEKRYNRKKMIILDWCILRDGAVGVLKF